MVLSVKFTACEFIFRHLVAKHQRLLSFRCCSPWIFGARKNIFVFSLNKEVFGFDEVQCYERDKNVPQQVKHIMDLMFLKSNRTYWRKGKMKVRSGWVALVTKLSLGLMFFQDKEEGSWLSSLGVYKSHMLPRNMFKKSPTSSQFYEKLGQFYEKLNLEKISFPDEANTMLY